MKGEGMRMRGEMKQAMQYSTTYGMQYTSIQNNAIQNKKTYMIKCNTAQIKAML
jgi:hypothetical protein